ncbi:MAG TPA: creatininase family protein [Chloroflexi bacterium]|jgi:creatinine amidohydrolase|nr:creatininase family protein [Chloroflexota bacterium]
MSKGYFLERMTWPQARQAFEKTGIVVIPTGSNEQHGRHLPTGTDWMVARELARRLAERAEVIVTPVLPFGYAKYHTVFPGTLALREETLKAALIDLCDDLLKYGATHFLFVNGHGGNHTALRQCGEWLRQQQVPAVVASWWTMAHVANPEWKMIGHADYVETAAMLAIDPSLVDWAEARNHKNLRLTDALELDNLGVVRFKGATMQINGVMTDVTETGDMLEVGESGATDYDIEPTTATAEMGNQILDSLADYLAEFIDEFRKVSFPAVGSVGPTAGLRRR